MATKFPLTDEQRATVDHVIKDNSIKIDAVAGSGKTSTLVAMSEALNTKSGLYIAFNKSIQQEAERKMPSNVESRTAHSLAYRAKAIAYKNAGKLGKCYPSVIAQQLRIGAIPPLTATATASLALETVTKYCYSADTEIVERHVNMSEFRKAGYKSGEIQAIRNSILAYARHLWSKMLNTRDPMPITHDVYVKIWALSDPYIPTDFILFDEAQDANPVLTDVVLKQTHANLIFVGDRYQQIYSWRGAENAMQSVSLDSYWLTKSFRFGQRVADVANYILNNQLNADIEVKGFEKIDSSIEKLHTDQYDCILSRTNVSLISNLFHALDNNYRPHINGGTSQLHSLLTGLRRIKEGGRSDHQDLRVFQTWQEIQEYAETDSGKDMKVPLDLIDKFGMNELINAVNIAGSITVKQSDYTLSTAHKSKGLEWDNVRLDDDFRSMKNDDDAPNQQWNPEEANLLYVACTRAIKKLDCSNVKDISHMCKSLEEVA